MTQDPKLNVAIVGGNFAGISAARQLDALTSDGLNIFLIDASDNFNWTPNIHELLSDVKQTPNVTLSRESLLANTDVKLVQSRVARLDHENKLLAFENGELLQFDACILACGYQSKNDFAAAGHHHFKTAEQVESLACELSSLIDEQEAVTVTIVGGGFSGVEALGELLRRYGKKDNFHIRVIESSDRLVRNLPQVISDDIINLAKDCQVSFEFGASIVEVEQGRLTLSNGNEIKSDITIWTTGGEVPTFIQETEIEQSLKGVKVDDQLQSANCQGVFVAGDIADVLIDHELALPKQSYHALEMGKVAASNAVNWLNGESLQTFEPKLKPIMLSFGDINTYMVLGETVLSSPALAATKESIYQLNLYKLTSNEPFINRHTSAVGRFIDSTCNLLLPEISLSTPFKLLKRSRVLQLGKCADYQTLVNGISGTVFDGI